jgi:hypothetical protein
MESQLKDFMVDELRRLIEDVQSARQPRNLILYTTIMQQLGPVYDRDRRLTAITTRDEK